jgi:hypothetical protein
MITSLVPWFVNCKIVGRNVLANRTADKSMKCENLMGKLKWVLGNKLNYPSVLYSVLRYLVLESSYSTLQPVDQFPQNIR